MLRKKNIVLNGKKATGNEHLRKGDSVKLFLADDTIAKFQAAGKTVEENIKNTVKLDVIYEDQNVIFINKPSGMLSQKAKETDVSVVENVTAYLLESGQLTKENLQTFRPSICNRLDRNTSGLIVAGKSLAGLQQMGELFKERTLKKYYLCIVKGRITEPAHISGYLVKNEKTNRVSFFKWNFFKRGEWPADRDGISSNRMESGDDASESTSDHRTYPSDSCTSGRHRTSASRRL